MGEIEAKNIVTMNSPHNILTDQRLLQKVLNMTADTLLVLDTENRCVDLLLKTDNPILNANTAIVGQDFLALLPAETATLVGDALQGVRETGQTSNSNYDLPTAEGMYYFKLIIHKFDADHVLCQYRDITKRSNMKGRLKTKALALMEVGKVARISHWTYDASNNKFSYFGYSSLKNAVVVDPQTTLLTDFIDMIHEADRAALIAFFEDPSPASRTIEYRMLGVGKPMEYLRSTRYIKTSDQPTVSGFTQNVTDFINNRQELETLVAVVHNSPNSVIAAKDNGEVVFVNKTCRRVNTLTEDKLLTDLTIEDVIEEFAEPGQWDEFKKAVRNADDVYRFRVKNKRPFVDVIAMECFASVIKNWKGEEIIWFFQHDISDQIRYEAQLLKSKEAAEESGKLKMAFISNMNHEIRTPLSSIIGLSMLMADTDEPELRHDYTKMITSSSEQLLRLITEVLEMSKIDAGNLSLIPKLESMHDIMQELQLSFKHVEGRANLYITVPALDTVAYFDKGRLMQLLINMINNSRKFTPPSGRIEVGYSIKEDKMELFVQDNGIGIPADKQQRIFNRFFKVNENDQGTGLGLAICKSIVDQMDGEIWVESENGKGATFKVLLPLEMGPQ